MIGKLEGYDFDYVVAEERESARRLAQHLIELGHRRIDLIGSDPENRCVVERCEGITDVLLQAGIYSESPPRGEVLCRNVRWTLPDWKGIVKDWFSEQDPPTALITINDSIALQLYPVLHQIGLSIPEDVSVVSFGDKPWSAYLEPPLTTSRADDEEVARLAFQTLMKRIENPRMPSVRIEVPQKFIIRESFTSSPIRSTIGNHCNRDYTNSGIL